jgi:hypothetical protein
MKIKRTENVKLWKETTAGERDPKLAQKHHGLRGLSKLLSLESRVSVQIHVEFVAVRF